MQKRSYKNQFGTKHYNWKGGRVKSSHGYWLVFKSDHFRAYANNYVYEHILIAEGVLGKPLPEGVEIHHCGEKGDNTRIVICQDHAYHMLLHRRMRALKACGHAGWRKCKICKQYDKPENLHVHGKCAYHKSCQAKYDHKRRN